VPTGENLGDFMKQPKLNEIRLDDSGTKEIRAKSKKSAKVKITINLDEDLIKNIKKRASKTGIPYQNLVNKMLLQAFVEQNNEDDRIAKIEKELKEIKTRLSA
jgi:predicted DNA binding CopG/RHH family protein